MRQPKRRPLADINVTPFVDIMLVLLIIFMVTTPLIKKSVQVDLPDGHAKDFNHKQTDILITLKKNGSLFVENESIQLHNLETHLSSLLEKARSKLLYLQADKSLSYGQVMSLMTRLHKAGYKISLVIKPVRT